MLITLSLGTWDSLGVYVFTNQWAVFGSHVHLWLMGDFELIFDTVNSLAFINA